MIAFVLTLLAGAAVAFVLYPIWVPPPGKLEGGDGAPQRAELMEKKERLLTAIQDLDFEYASGKLSEADHGQARGELMAEAAGLLERLDRLGVPSATHEIGRQRAESASVAPPEPPRKRKRTRSPSPSLENLRPFCIRCGQQNPRHARFCFRCGARIELLSGESYRPSRDGMDKEAVP
jgi:hypothetical protein